MFHVEEKTKTEYYKMFDRTEKMVEDDVLAIKSWFQTQPHLPEVMDDTRIRNFLNMNKFSIEKTKQKIDMYYTMRSLMPDMFSTPPPNTCDEAYYCFLPKLLNGKHRVQFLKIKNPNVSPLDLAQLFFSTYEVRISDDFVTDDVLVIDWEHANFSTIQKFTPTLVAKAISIYQKVYSLRLNSAYYINSPSYVIHVLTALKAVMKPKIFQRIQVFKDTKIMSEIFSKEELPKDYGGDGPSLDDLTELVKQKIKNYQERFRQLESLKVDESLRPEKLNNDEILGFYGNFKKIDVD